MRRPPSTPLFPYTTLFRSARVVQLGRAERSPRIRVEEHEVGISTDLDGTLALEPEETGRDRKSTRLNSSHVEISYAVFCLKKKNNNYKRYHTIYQQNIKT